MSSRNRNYCFTVNNYSETCINRLNAELDLNSRVDYMLFATEVGESGTRHLQGYIELNCAMSLTALKTFLCLPKSIHLEPRRGTQEQAVQYCLKEEVDKVVYQWGTPKASRSRAAAAGKNKLLPFKEQLLEEGLASVSNDPDCTFHLLKHAQAFLSINETPRDRTVPLTVYWLWGPTGTGKTHRAYTECEEANVVPYIKSSGTKWFDGYDGESHVIFDDLRDSWFEFSFLLKLLDVYPHRVECKGGSRQWKPEVIFITAPKPPSEMYLTMQLSDKYDSIQQLLRRVSSVIHMNDTYVAPKEESLASSVREAFPMPSPYHSNHVEFIRRCFATNLLPSQTQLFDCPSPLPTQQLPLGQLVSSDEESQD
uniref:Replication-associated protein n=1 Tax=Cressdnaviricota sp. TaxID=2748378 RepID=A0A7G8LJ19_9VIRU|nr:replication protein [Cressdnaviricota sp.]